VTEPGGPDAEVAAQPAAEPAAAPVRPATRWGFAWRLLGGGPDAPEHVTVEGESLLRADRLAAAALAFVLLGAIGGGILEIVYALIE
jgi:hypothetical protein